MVRDKNGYLFMVIKVFRISDPQDQETATGNSYRIEPGVYF